VKIYSSAAGGIITVTVPPEAKVIQLTPEKNYNDEVKLVAPTARFWSNSEVINGRRVVTSGVKIRAKDVVVSNVGKSNTKEIKPDK
jgi:CxxC motif-containing protein